MVLTELIGRSLAAVHTLTHKSASVASNYGTSITALHPFTVRIYSFDQPTNTIMIDLERYLTQHHASHAWSRAQCKDHWYDDAAVFEPTA